MEEFKTTGLPEDFTGKMRVLLGADADAFFQSYDETRRYGLRINPLKCGGELPAYLQGLKRIPWAAEGYYYEEPMRPGKHPYHEAGVYYIQEPSAMSVAEALEPKPGERILDLCAAPGGKSTHLAGKMDQRGLLVCNEIHPARAKILAQNVERMGIANAVVTNMEPAGLVEPFREFFDGIVVDAPCSGEGMFRKDENARNEWSLDHVILCANRQDMILDCAADMLRYGGRIAYSTCTFSPEENEQAIARFIGRHPEFRVERPACAGHFEAGHPEWCKEAKDVPADGNGLPVHADGSRMNLEDTVRIWPHKVDGEGHFLALLVKGERADLASNDSSADTDGASEMTAMAETAGLDLAEARGRKRADRSVGKKPGREARGMNGGKTGKSANGPVDGRKDFQEFCDECLTDTEAMLRGRKFLTFGDNLYLVPEEMRSMDGLRVLRPGLHVGTLKKGRMEPSHALALYLKPDQVLRSLEIGSGETAERYLRGETVTIPEEAGGLKGWVLVTTDDYSIGFGKADRGVLKNHYPKGLRRP